ncbi:sterol desaturase family protein [Methylobacterium radiotolerans]|uniref:sterol desaturase family protein n=1 Tax=Methylobacterium radiotolerans TaxID=31998 RepID=UPI000D5D6E0F|nr:MULTISPECIES: sterol desaturase family protein [Methylobacterium]MDE3748606.1 sterol desaturase family protein [Methylobacterium radiotolerans]PVZ05014.1 sterol desaturase/sphingolipid hydroxylase (fatty acid hydroxylase superfamily) [Methylobacterium organophilum]
MTDIFKHIIHAPQLIITWTMFFGFGLVFYVAYIVKNRIQFSIIDLYKHCVPFDVLREKSFHTDLKIYFIGKLTDGFIVAPAVLLTALCCEKYSSMLHLAFPAFNTIEFNVFYAGICTILMFLVAEFSDYLCHYVEHKVPFLWELHKVHHSAQMLNPLTSKRGHPVSMALEAIVRGLLTAIPGGLFMFLFGLSVVEATSLSWVASKIFVLLTLDPLKHSHLPISLGIFDKILISPHMHQIHHSKVQDHWDKNFGTNLSIFDWALGTAYKPSRGEISVFGIAGLKDETLMKYNSLYGSYVDPVMKSYKKIRKFLGGKLGLTGRSAS